jgi:hypothetical protein
VNSKGIIYRITLFVSELLVDLCKCECGRMNVSSIVISQLLLFCLSDPSSMLSIQPDILICVEPLFSLFVALINIFIFDFKIASRI